MANVVYEVERKRRKCGKLAILSFQRIKKTPKTAYIFPQQQHHHSFHPFSISSIHFLTLIEFFSVSCKIKGFFHLQQGFVETFYFYFNPLICLQEPSFGLFL